VCGLTIWNKLTQDLRSTDTRERLSVAWSADYLSVHTAGGASDRRWLKAHHTNGFTYLLTYLNMSRKQNKSARHIHTYSDHGSGRSSRKLTTLSRWWEASRQMTWMDALNAIWPRANLVVFVHRLVNTSSTYDTHTQSCISQSLLIWSASCKALMQIKAQCEILWVAVTYDTISGCMLKANNLLETLQNGFSSKASFTVPHVKLSTSRSILILALNPPEKLRKHKWSRMHRIPSCWYRSVGWNP